MATNVYYSVGQNTSDHKTGSPKVTISSGVATFDVAQIATNLGVGDRVTHSGGDGLCYLKSKVSNTVWNVCTKLGANPTNITNEDVTSIAHEYVGLSAAEAGASDSNHINNTDLTAADVILNIPCYYDSGIDGGNCTIDGWTTDATRFINIYTPYNTATECNQSQRHAGVYNTGCYYRGNSDANSKSILIKDDNVRIDGLQITLTNTTTNLSGVEIDSIGSVADVRVSNCIFVGPGAGNAQVPVALWVVSSATIHADAKIKFWNNVAYLWGNGNGGACYIPHTSAHTWINSNTFVSCNLGILVLNSNTVIKNNICYLTALDYFTDSTWGTGSTNNAYDCNAPGATNDKLMTSATVGNYFVSATNYHLNSAGANVLEISNDGADLSGDSVLPITTDIDQMTRYTPWSCGADQLPPVTPIYYNHRQTQKMS
jgi:hypothetical protein